MGFAFGCFVAACGNPATPPPPTAAKKPKAPTTAEAAPTPKIDYTYNPVGKRDPFRPNTPTGRSAAEAEETPTCAEPLCQYKVDELTLVAIMSGEANPVVVLEDRAGVGYIARRFSSVGREGGKITGVSSSCITVTAYTTNLAGKSEAKKTTLCIPEDPKSAPVLDLYTGRPL